MTFNTGNPIGSADARDRLDNSENMDILENSTTLNAHPDRLGTMRKTRKGMELEHDNQIAAHEAEHDAQIAAHEDEHDNQMQSFENEFDSRLAGMAFTRVGTFTTGATLTDMRQTLLWEVSQGGDGREYGWTGSFSPSGKVVIAGSNPETTGGIGAGAWVDRTDVILQANLAATTGAGLVGTTDGITVQAKLNAIAADKANTSYVNAALALKANTSDLATKADTETVISRTKKGGLTTAVAGGAMTLTQAKRLFSFRSSTMTNGTAVEVTPAADMTLTVPNGASLGVVSGVPAEYLEILLYNGGSPVVGIVNAACGQNLDESGLISSSAISASAKSATTVYSSVAVENSPYIVLNRLSVTLPTAGVWSVRPNVQPMDLTSLAMFTRRIFSPSFSIASGTVISVSGIPSWAKRISIIFNDVQPATSSNLLVRVGNDSLITAGYTSGDTVVSTSVTSSTSGASSTAGFVLRGQTAGNMYQGVMTLNITRSSVMELATIYNFDNVVHNAAGKLALTGGVTQLTLTTVGVVAFSGGEFSLVYEG